MANYSSNLSGIKVLNWKPYLESICSTYAEWWETYTLTNVVGKKRDTEAGKSQLLSLKVLAITPEKEKPEAADNKKELLNVLEGLRKHAPDHVLLIGRPGSGKSTALARLLLEEAERPLPQPLPDAGRGEFSHPSLAGKGAGGLGQIPVLVELRYYQTSVFDLIKDFLHRHDPNLEKPKKIKISARVVTKSRQNAFT